MMMMMHTGDISARAQPVFRSGSDLVRVFATVTDRDGRLVTTLNRENFEVRHGGKPQPIEAFDDTPTPIRLVLMLDISGSMHGNLELIREAPEALFARFGAADLARVGSFGRTIALSSEFTRDLTRLRAALPRSIEASAPTPLWSALGIALQAFEGEAERRPVILVLSDGKDDVGPLGSPARLTVDDVIDQARRQDVMIYAVGLRSRLSSRFASRSGRLPPTLDDGAPDPGLRRLAAETGGGYTEIDRGEDLAGEFARIADELHSQYLVGFAPPVRDGRVHQIDLRVTQRGMKVRARKSYVAPTRP
jgi:VWFA-related protein